jgi:5-bromo-4-chloroindolyl phosphate hydrolysis protein
MTDVQIHWFSIVNSVIVVFFLAGILSMIIVKTLRRDIARYNQEDSVSFYQKNLNKINFFHLGRCYRRNWMEIVG